MIGIVIGLSSCTARHNSFLKAEDYPYPELPQGGVRQDPAYPVPPSVQEELVFVSRPRPQPQFIGEPPSSYDQSKIRNSGEYDQIFSLGFNTKKEASLFISPFYDEDVSSIDETLRQLGIESSEDRPIYESLHYELQGNEQGLRILTIYRFNNAAMISIAPPETKKRGQRKKEEYNPAEDFIVLERLRNTILDI